MLTVPLTVPAQQVHSRTNFQLHYLTQFAPHLIMVAGASVEFVGTAGAQHVNAPLQTLAHSILGV